eukprot:scaffold12009_cov61-Cyclotella_meneghiniana.AAC.11
MRRFSMELVILVLVVSVSGVEGRLSVGCRLCLCCVFCVVSAGVLDMAGGNLDFTMHPRTRTPPDHRP